VHIELYNAAQEQQKITEKRLRDMLGGARAGLTDSAPRPSGARSAAAAAPASRLANVSRHITGTSTSGREVGAGGITSHVLDTCQGRPASGLGIRLECDGPDGYTLVASAVSNEQGRVTLVENGRQIAAGRYRVCFDLAGYYARCREDSPEFFTAPSPFFPEASVVFDVSEAQSARWDHFHVPLTWGGPFGYSTYRGS
jgi:hydroxyisourate hydrolase